MLQYEGHADNNSNLHNLPSTSKAHDVLGVNLLLDGLQPDQIVTKDPLDGGVLLRVVAVEGRVSDVLALGHSNLREMFGAAPSGLAHEVVRGREQPGEIDVERKQRACALGRVRGGGELALAEETRHKRLDVERDECGGRKAQSGSPELRATKVCLVSTERRSNGRRARTMVSLTTASIIPGDRSSSDTVWNTPLWGVFSDIGRETARDRLTVFPR